MLSIRTARLEELEAIMTIYSHAQDFMIANGNPSQWGHFYPDAKQIESDIACGACKVIYDELGIHGVCALFEGDEPTYEHIEDGNWLNDEPYMVIHRLASDGQAHGIFNCVLSYCRKLATNIRVDTHENNLNMQGLFEKNGFVRCGIIHVKNGSARIAYQWDKFR